MNLGIADPIKEAQVQQVTGNKIVRQEPFPHKDWVSAPGLFIEIELDNYP